MDTMIKENLRIFHLLGGKIAEMNEIMSSWGLRDLGNGRNKRKIEAKDRTL